MKLALVILAILFSCLVTVPVAVRASLSSGTLADAMGTIINANSWNPTDDDVNVPHYATVFSMSNPAYYQSAAALASSDPYYPVEVLHNARLAELDGFPNAVSNSTIQAYLSSVAMLGYLPVTYNRTGNYYLIYHRFSANAWTYGSGSEWNASGALAQVNAIIMGGSPYGYTDPVSGAKGPGTYIGYTQSGGWNTYYRYYDDTAETMDWFLELGGTSYLNTCDYIWAFENGLSPFTRAYFWNGQYYGYNGQTLMETEVGPFALVSGNYLQIKGTFNDYKDRIVSDLNQKLLESGYSSPLWNHYSLNHVPGYDERRLENAAAAWAAMEAYYPVMTSTMQSTLQGMGAVGWRGLLDSSGDFYPSVNQFGWRNNGITSMAATGAGLMILFFNGIVPRTGSIAVPLNDENYEDCSAWSPATMFRFDYANHQIRIPVNAGTIDFIFGTGTASWNFAQTGVYTVQFSDDWNTVQNANYVGALDSRFQYVLVTHGKHDIATTNLVPASMIVGQGLPLNISVTVANLGNYPETFNLTCYANATVVSPPQTINLPDGDNATVLFTWNTSGFDEGNYVISAYAEPVANETNTSNNEFMGGVVTILAAHDVSISDVTFSEQNPSVNDTATAYVTVQNFGGYTENFNVSVSYSLDNETTIGTQILTLASGTIATLNFTWTPTVDGLYTIRAFTSEIFGDPSPDDNIKTAYIYVVGGSCGGGGRMPYMD